MLKTKILLGVLWAITALNVTYVVTMVGLHS